jgi:hypothetical protein
VRVARSGPSAHWARLSAAAASVGLLLAALGCAGPNFGLDELPGESLVVVYRTLEESERMGDAEERRKGRPKTPGVEPGAFITFEDFQRATGLRTRWDQDRDVMGRMGFVDPKEGRISNADFARRGSRPLNWSQDRERLLFLTKRRERTHVVEWNRSTGDLRNVTSGDRDHGGACYGPDGAVAFVRMEPLRGVVGPARSLRVRRTGLRPGPRTAAALSTTVWRPSAVRSVRSIRWTPRPSPRP